MISFSCYLFLLIYLLNKLWIDKHVRRLILSERTERNKNNRFQFNDSFFFSFVFLISIFNE